MRFGKSMIALAGALIMAVLIAHSPSLVLAEGGAHHDMVRQAAESAAAESAAPSSTSKNATILDRDGQVEPARGIEPLTCGLQISERGLLKVVKTWAIPSPFN